MPSTRRDDLVYALLLTGAFCAFVLTGFGSLAWQLSALPLAAIGLGLALRAPPLLLSASTAATLAVITAYLFFTASLGREGGLAWIGLWFSAPGMLLGIGATVWLLRYRFRTSLPWIVAGLGFAGAVLGFMLGQLVVCNSLMDCGPLTLA